MKSTEHFKKVIEDYLNDRAEKDKLFAEKYANEKKNIDDCITYILNEVQKNGYNGARRWPFLLRRCSVIL